MNCTVKQPQGLFFPNVSFLRSVGASVLWNQSAQSLYRGTLIWVKRATLRAEEVVPTPLHQVVGCYDSGLQGWDCNMV